MNDTNSEMKMYQYNLIMSKTAEERFIMGLEMAEEGRLLMIAGIKAQRPYLTEKELVKEIIKRQMIYDDSLSWLNDYI